LKALEIAARHSGPIEESWRRTLERLGFTREEMDAVAGLRLQAHQRELKFGDIETYTAAVERQAEILAGRGLPESQARTARFCHLESILPYLAAEASRPAELSAALVRLTFAGALCISAGYDRARTASWQSFGEQERQRLSRDLHDEIGHHLVVLKLYLEMIGKDSTRGKPPDTRRKIGEALGLVTQAIQSVRRLILDLGPAVLEEVGFLPAVKLYARQFTSHTGIRVEVRDRGLPAALPANYATALYRVLQGALSNVVKHARASRVTVTLGSPRRSIVRMTVEDNGIGFDVDVPRQAYGLAAMRERLAGLGGRFQLESRPAGPAGQRSGTRIEAELPLGGIVWTR
jgi:signal transduction histidine kinase